MSSFFRVTVMMLVALLPCRSGWAQQQPVLAPREAALKVEADRLLPGAPIRVRGLQAPEQYGVFVSNDPQGLTYYSVLVDRNVTVAYADVKQIKEGRGGFDPNTGKHKSHREAIIITAVVTVVLVGGVLGGFAH